VGVQGGISVSIWTARIVACAVLNCDAANCAKITINMLRGKVHVYNLLCLKAVTSSLNYDILVKSIQWRVMYDANKPYCIMLGMGIFRKT